MACLYFSYVIAEGEIQYKVILANAGGELFMDPEALSVGAMLRCRQEGRFFLFRLINLVCLFHLLAEQLKSKYVNYLGERNFYFMKLVCFFLPLHHRRWFFNIMYQS